MCVCVCVCFCGVYVQLVVVCVPLVVMCIQLVVVCVQHEGCGTDCGLSAFSVVSCEKVELICIVTLAYYMVC